MFGIAQQQFDRVVDRAAVVLASMMRRVSPPTDGVEHVVDRVILQRRGDHSTSLRTELAGQSSGAMVGRITPRIEDRRHEIAVVER